MNPTECRCCSNQGMLNQDHCFNNKCHPKHKGKANYGEQSHENFKKDPNEQTYKNFKEGNSRYECPAHFPVKICLRYSDFWKTDMLEILLDC